MFLIYKVTNKINNKVYIGQSINPIEERWQRHCNDALHNILDTHFARAIRKYGPESFTIELLDDTATSQDELTLKEHNYIQKFDSIKNGYNETDATNKCGGNTYLSKTPEELEEIGYKISISKMGSLNPNARAIKCKNINTNEELFFGSMAEGAQYFKMKDHHYISRRCRGEITYLYNGEWMFAYANEEYGKFSKTPHGNRWKQVEVLNLNTQEKQIFDNYHEAEKACGFGKDYLSKTFRSKQTSIITRKQYQITQLN